MTILLMETSGPAAGDEIVAAVQAQQLWGVSMGTTSSAAAYSDRALVECTKTRAFGLLEACPDDVSISVYDEDPPSFSASNERAQVWFLRGRL